MAKMTAALIAEIENGIYDEILLKLCVDPARLSGQKERYIEALKEFAKLYGEKAVEVYSAPGRSEIGGNHTDHQNGRVLATSVNIDTIAVVAALEGSVIKMKSQGYRPLSVDISKLEPDEREYGTSVALIRGVAAGLAKRGYKIGGMELYCTSEVLSGSGLSSSAAFEVMIGNAISGLYNGKTADAVLLAQIGQEAENTYFGKPCGLMDQMACSYGGLIHIDFNHPGTPAVSPVHVEFEKYGTSLCIVDTKGSHADLTPDYAAIPTEMRAVAACFGKTLLCEVSEEDFVKTVPTLRAKTGDRAVLRALHWYAECKRADAEKEALEKDDFKEFLSVLKESGDSSYKYLQNVFSTHKVEEQGVSIGLAFSEYYLGKKGVARVHGGGFAGTMQAFVPDELVAGYKENIEKIFGAGSCHVMKVRSIGGTRVM